QASGQGVDSPFEAQVIRALRARGHQVEGQVGTAGYFIDIGVKDPDQPGRYLLGIECDGASYHSSRSARDRDRLRQSVLEGLGWRFHRIWSTDWFRHPDQELARIETAIAAAREDQPAPRRSAVVAEPVLQRQAETKDEAQPLAEPYRLAALPDLSRRQLTDQGVEALAQLLQAVVAVESPIHESDAQRRVMGAFGVTRAGSRVNAVLDGALDWGVRWGHFVRRDGFLWRDAEQVANVRDRRALESGLRRIEGIAPEELDAALCESLRLGFSLAADAAVSSALSLLGFGRATSKLQEPLRERLDVLVATGRVSQQGEAYRLAT
ncbi:MAG: DUF3320 domain-containing protein, partial [Gammaproteobacteria bacterium]|nr:DUF3320 domain-containing protein [Gammaproteobacteria bacterium]